MDETLIKEFEERASLAEQKLTVIEKLIFAGALKESPAAVVPEGAQANSPAQAAVPSPSLQQIIQQNRLETFYPPPALQNVVNRASRVDFRALAQRYNMPMELAVSLAGLALYDTVIFVDDSGSMAFEENGSRINDLKLILGRVAEVATMFDDDGILIGS
ncbi:hypothetical protein WJX84_003291 [Apatococcus fuscideae]|uniref:VWFA domain-containing protein n=1 Tax=Apatococcus fuscideae TaxID=2026836 RepID=A0AAW1STW3_9CHLO